MTEHNILHDAPGISVSADQRATETQKYEVNLDGDIQPWPNPTITVPEIRGLASWSDNQPVVMVDLKSNEERDLREDEVIDLKPGHGFSKKVKFKRGAK